MAFRMLTKVIVVSLSLAVAVGFSELVYRGVYQVSEGRKTDFREPSADAYEEPNESFGKYRTIAKMEYDSYLAYVPQADFSTPIYHTNRDHFRYFDDFPAVKPKDERRVFVTGGSTAWGVGAKQEKMYSQVAERRLSERYAPRKIRVVPAAAGGWCTTQERIMLENRVLGFSPDAVVMLSGWNDTYFAYRGKKVLQNNDFLNYRHLIDGNRPALSALNPPQYGDYTFKLGFLKDQLRYRLKYPDRAALEREITAQSVPVEQAVDSLLRNVEVVSDLARRYGFVFLYILQPCVYSTEKATTPWEKNLIAWGDRNEIGFPEYLRAMYHDLRTRLPQHAARNGYAFFDADGFIAEEKNSVFADTVHLGDRGNRIIGEALAVRLQRLADAKFK